MKPEVAYLQVEPYQDSELFRDYFQPRGFQLRDGWYSNRVVAVELSGHTIVKVQSKYFFHKKPDGTRSQEAVELAEIVQDLDAVKVTDAMGKPVFEEILGN